MTRREIRSLFAAFREIARPGFWFWSFPQDPKTGAQLVLLAILVFAQDLLRLILLPEGRGKPEF